MGTARPRPVVLDTAALIQVDRGDRRMLGLLRTIREHGSLIVIPAGVLAEAWRDGTRQARLATLVRAPQTDVVVLDEPMAKAAGALCGRTRTSGVVDATVVIAARMAGATVVTSDAEDLRRLDPEIALEAI